MTSCTVLEDREVIDINKAFLGDDPDLEKKIRYLGKITNRVYGELPLREEALERFGLTDRKTVLISLGRNNRVSDLSLRLFDVLAKTGLTPPCQVVNVLDPYLDSDLAESIKNHPLSKGVRFLPFVPDLVDLVHHSDLVISRAGYNIVNEILLTGTPAILIPESHGGGEQEMRAQSLHEDSIRVLTEDDAFGNVMTEHVSDLLNGMNSRPSYRFDKYAIGKQIIEDLEAWKARSKNGR